MTKNKLWRWSQKIDFWMIDSKVNISIFCVIITILGGILYTFNYWTPLLADDFGYRVSRITGQPVSSFSDIFWSEYHHYFTWGGRVINHFLAQCFLWWGKTYFNILNTFAYLGLILLIYIHALGKWVWRPSLLIIISTGLLLFLPAWGQDILWLTGSANYLWSILIVLIFLLPFRFQMEREKPVLNNPALCSLYMVFGCIAGWTNENLTVGLNCIACLYIWYFYHVRHRRYTYMIWGIAGTIVGALFLLLAPGNIVRAGDATLIKTVIKGIGHVFRKFFQLNSLFYPCLIVMGLCVAIKNSLKVSIWKIYFIGGIVTHISMIASPYYSDRAVAPALFFLLIALVNLYSMLPIQKTKMQRNLFIIVMTGLVITSVNIYRYAYKDIKNCYIQMEDRKAYLQQEKLEGRQYVTLQPVVVSTDYTGASKNEEMCDQVLIANFGLKIEDLKGHTK